MTPHRKKDVDQRPVTIFDRKLEQEIEVTDARFGIRSLIFVTTLVAILAAIGGTILNHCPPEARKPLTLYWAALLTATVGYTTFAFHKRRQLEEYAGRTILRVPISPAIGPFSRIMLQIFGCACSLMVWVYASYAVITAYTTTATASFRFELAMPIVLSWIITVNLVPGRLWQGTIRLSDNGILWDRGFLPWHSLLEHRWIEARDHKLELYSLDSSGIRPWLSLKVDRTVGPHVEQIIQSKLASVRTLPASSRRVGLSRIPLFEALGKRHIHRHFPFVMLSSAGGCGLAYLGFQSSGIREFHDVFFVVMFLAIYTNAWKAWWTTKYAGEPLARLFARRDVLGFVSYMGLAVTVHYVSTQALWPYWWCNYGAALLYLYFAFNAITYYMMTELDLRTEGIVMVGVFRWPWSRIQVRTIERRREVTFILRRRWRCVIATVPQDEAGLVRLVLQQKINVDA